VDPTERVSTMVRAAFPDRALFAAEPLAGGLRNSNFKLRFEPAAEPLVLRIYEHDRALCRKEVDLHRLVGETIPIPEILHAATDGIDGSAPFVIMRYVEGITFRELESRGDARAIAKAAASIGETLAAIGRYTFPKPGWLEPGPTVGSPLLAGADPCPRFVDECLASVGAEQRMDSETRDRVHAFVWSWAPRLASLDDERSLVHCDFSSRNLLVRERGGQWAIAAVLDWEFAVSASPLVDVGHFLRYERTPKSGVEPEFSLAFTRAGGRLPADWLPLSRVLDLTALCEMLSRPMLPDAVVPEIVELVRATVEDRAPST
jgi:aminoglycoside phosphotransferase (APT) family kinase protein